MCSLSRAGLPTSVLTHVRQIDSRMPEYNRLLLYSGGCRIHIELRLIELFYVYNGYRDILLLQTFSADSERISLITHRNRCSIKTPDI